MARVAGVSAGLLGLITAVVLLIVAHLTDVPRDEIVAASGLCKSQPVAK